MHTSVTLMSVSLPLLVTHTQPVTFWLISCTESP
jgi:hypothetical protein